jgi:hypothetical protein
MLPARIRNSRTPLLAIAALTVTLRLVEAYLLALPGLDTGPVLWLAIPGTIALCGAVWWFAVALALESVQSSTTDLRPIAGEFDASGSPVASRS